MHSDECEIYKGLLVLLDRKSGMRRIKFRGTSISIVVSADILPEVIVPLFPHNLPSACADSHDHNISRYHLQDA